MTGRLRPLLLIVTALLVAGHAAAQATLITGSGRVDFNWLREAPPDTDVPIEDGATNLEAWFELRALSRNWEAAARLRVHQSNGIADDPDFEDLDRRHLALTLGAVEAWAGNFYTTLGNGLILRTLEQRFVTLARETRAFNLDRNLDGVRVTTDTGPVRVVALSGRPRNQSLAEDAGGGADRDLTDDLLQGGEASVNVLGHGTVSAGFIRAELVSPDGLWEGREEMDLPSARARGILGDWEAEFEYAEIRPTGGMTGVLAGYRRGIARYARATGPVGPVGVSLEAKSYRRFDTYTYNQPPTLVRTHTAVLLNRATHVVFLNDERGFQGEALWSPDLDTQFIVNLSGAESADSDVNDYREVYLSARREAEDLGALRLDLDWQRDKAKDVENRWTAVIEVEGFLADGYSVVADLELQRTERTLDRTSNWQLLQIGASLADRWTVSLTGEHTDEASRPRSTWLFGSVTAKINRMHDVTVGYGTRPAGLVCSGGFCFTAPAFDGFEARLLSRF